MAGSHMNTCMAGLHMGTHMAGSHMGTHMAGSHMHTCMADMHTCMAWLQTACLLRVPVEVVKQRAQAAPHLSSPLVFRNTVTSETACLLRVPVEVVKQRAQAAPHLSSPLVFRNTVTSEGFRGLYRGYFSTVAREIPFSLIQFPLWELFKKTWSERTQQPIAAWQSSVCGALAGGISAAVTTPLDVAKTRIMLAEKDSSTARGNIMFVVREVYAQQGLRGIFSGVVPRVLWISVGGAIFLGIYDKARLVIQDRCRL